MVVFLLLIVYWSGLSWVKDGKEIKNFEIIFPENWFRERKRSGVTSGWDEVNWGCQFRMTQMSQS